MNPDRRQQRIRTMFTKEIVRLVGSVVTESQETVWVLLLASHIAPNVGAETEIPRAVATNERTAERKNKSCIASVGKVNEKNGK